ncbi:MAG: cupredoxin domain-containing protein [Acidimicrobiales bacterium]
MTRSRRLPAKLAVVLVVAVLGLGACGGSSDDDAADTTAADDAGASTSDGVGAGGDQVTIKGFAFKPTPLTVKVGTAVMVKNEDNAVHTLTADDKSFDTGQLDGGKSGSVTVSKAGDIAYHCEIHDYMKGVIRVEG